MKESYQKKSSLNSDGSREKIRIADVRGRFTSAKTVVFAILIFIYAFLPILKLSGHPVILIDILHRRFYLFGTAYNSQDFYLVFFLITGVLFVLFYFTALVGRIWCGWACPQTVFLEGVFRKIERWIEGPRSAQILLSKEPFHLKKTSKLVLKHSLYLLAALIITHIFLSYFVSLEHLLEFVVSNPKKHWEAFLWMLSISGVIYFNFAWFREQLCLIVCPYGRIQSALIDDDTLIIGYDAIRGEPRGKKNQETRGDCINCRRCVDVCPTGIDIREGLQLECVGCANCLDACNDVMKKIGQAQGLIRYDSHKGLTGQKRHILRPRIYFYTGMLLIGMLISYQFFARRSFYEANIIRATGAPYVLEGELIRNQFVLHLVNKSIDPVTFEINPDSTKPHFVIPLQHITLESMQDIRLPFFVELERKSFVKEEPFYLNLTSAQPTFSAKISFPFVGP